MARFVMFQDYLNRSFALPVLIALEVATIHMFYRVPLDFFVPLQVLKPLLLVLVAIFAQAIQSLQHPAELGTIVLQDLLSK
jgi:hypothetical protein